jgi:type I restriction enzyme M protein
MNTETHRQFANFIWNICNLLRGPYKRKKYRQALITAAVTAKFGVCTRTVG